jgi:hypothetical protein
MLPGPTGERRCDASCLLQRALADLQQSAGDQS